MSAPMQHPKTDSPLRSETSMIGASQVAGYVLDPSAPERRFVVELLLDGYSSALGRADLYDPDLAKQGFGDGCYGFAFTIDPLALPSVRRIEVRLANSGEIVGAPLDTQAPPSKKNQGPGEVQWLGGLRFTGWVSGDPARANAIRASVDGEIVASAVATGWTHVGEGDDIRAFRRFDLHLPARFADGCARAATFLDEEGAELAGSPCAFAAFHNGLSRFIESRAEIESEKLRGDLFDRLIPQSLPFAMFEEWRRAFPPEAPPAGDLPKVAVTLIGADEIEASVASLEAQQGCLWVAAALEGGAGQTDFDNASLRQFLDGDAKEWPILLFAPSGAILQPQALALLAQALAAHPSADLAYADFSFAAPDGAEWPVALPAFDYELTLEQGAGALFFAARADYARAAAEAGADDLFRLFMFGQDRRRALGIRRGEPLGALPVHQPGFLARLPKLDLADSSRRLARAVEAHLAARGAQAKVGPGHGALLPSARVRRPAPLGKVSFLIPTRDRADLLEACFESLARTVELARHEIIVLDNDSVEPATAAFFERISARGARVLRVGGPFNFARIVNKGASVASGEFLLLLNNDVEALQNGWLEEMLGRMAEPDVGAVGAALLWPSGVIQHGGVTLGANFAATHVFNDRIDGDPGYADLLRAAHECSAVTAACLLTERRLFLEIGGFDGASYPVNFNDVDYCLKLRSRGLRVVLTPHARLLHRESASRGLDERPDRADRFQRELRNLRTAWRDALLADPAYHPMLSLDRTPYSALAWPPRPARPRQPVIAPPHPIPPGF